MSITNYPSLNLLHPHLLVLCTSSRDVEFPGMSCMQARFVIKCYCDTCDRNVQRVYDNIKEEHLTLTVGERMKVCQ